MAISTEIREIPVGLVGEVRRSVAGARLQLDPHHPELEFNLVMKGTCSITLDERK